ncbi:MBL fold metallo-hydrolase [Priestia flexa]|uniref:MBL fold metallo-hydrolase n=1 Tax=Priestia flexa TaxID=86664 RepID=UPI000473F5BC|nr:MBL fold metallo-hydrolase [Priestia flexa]
MIKVTALGVNGAFTKNYHNNFVFELGSRKLLVDAGTTLRNSLHGAGFKETDITDIFITHLHSDHVGGLEEFAQKCKWIYNHKPNLWVRYDMIDELFEVIEKGLCTDGLTIYDYFTVGILGSFKGTGEFNIESHRIKFIETDNMHCEGMTSTALKFYDLNGYNVIYSSDIKNLKDSGLIDHVNDSTKGIFQDCSLVPNNVHSTVEEVIEYYGEGNKNKIYAMHYQDDVNAREADDKYGIRFMITGHITF